ncbi:MAG: UMP kinase [Spirochaetaceae bacterium]|jgi:uridylate kinase|nr:UMP kinase [Spirochaetaceae bacterium]
MITVISLGGSIVAPDKPDAAYLSAFKALIEACLAKDAASRFILVVGGGGPARQYQEAYRAVAGAGIGSGGAAADEADWIGIMATRLNAQLVRAVFAAHTQENVVTDPTAPFDWEGRVLVAAGWQPGFSSDNDAVLLAARFGAKRLINLSNIEKVYTADPKIDPSARPIDAISWKDFRALVGDEWSPGKNVPFDPIASKHAESAGLTVICAAGKNLENLKNILRGGPFTGTTIG